MSMVEVLTKPPGVLRARPRHAWSVSLTLLVGCASLVGIDDARVDPMLGAPGGGTLAAEGGRAGSGATNAGDTPSEGGTSSATGAGGATPDPCAEYCSQVTTHCTAGFAVYTGESACVSLCAKLPKGNPGDTIGNSVQCRLQNARLVGETAEPAVHCPIAGPGGSGTCGSDCESYCVLLQSICSVRFGQAYQDLVDCNRQCAALASAGPYNISQSSGDTINCRLWHITAASLDPGNHCGHASGDPPCAP